MSKKELETIVENLQNRNDLYFNDAKDSQFWMLKKIVLKQLSKLLPKDSLGSRALSFDDQVEGGAVLTLDDEERVIIMNDKKSTKKGLLCKTCLYR